MSDDFQRELQELNVPPENMVEVFNKIIDIDTFFDEFTKEVGLSNLDADDLHCVRQHFICYRNASNIENFTNKSIQLTQSKILLLHTVYNILTTSNSYKAKKLDTLVSRIIKMIKNEDKKKKNIFGGEREE